MKYSDLTLGMKGNYTFSEAAKYLETNGRTLKRWFLEDGAPLRDPVYLDNGTPLLTFQDFIEAFVVKILRQRFSMRKIREAVRSARDNYQIDYPFSDSRHSVSADKTDLHIYIHNEQTPTQLTGKRLKGQRSFPELIEPYLKRISYDEHTFKATEFIAANYFGHDITINPRFLLGEPRPRDCPFTAATLWRSCVAEGDEGIVASLFDVDIDIVRASSKYCEKIKLAA